MTSERVRVPIHQADPQTSLPKQAVAGSAGYDLVASEDTCLPAVQFKVNYQIVLTILFFDVFCSVLLASFFKVTPVFSMGTLVSLCILKPWRTHVQTVKVQTGLSMEIPDGYFCNIRERSGLAVAGVKVGGGVIDPSYRGTVAVLLSNLTSTDIKIKRGDRIAQMLIQRYCDVEFVSMASKDQLSTTTRDTGGFGSTGIR